MPMHDWTRVDAGLYHHFHQQWSGAICDALNAGVLPGGHFALVEQHAGGAVADTLTLRSRYPAVGPGPADAATATPAPPQVRHTRRRTEADVYAARASRVAVRHRHGDVVAVIEVVSPGNKSPKDALTAFVRKSVELLRVGVHLLVVDPFPPGPRDPRGIHPEVWEAFDDDPYTPPPDGPLTAASYDAGDGVEQVAYVEPFAVGRPVPDLPLFLRPGEHITCPLEAAYADTWGRFPAALKGLLG